MAKLKKLNINYPKLHYASDLGYLSYWGTPKFNCEYLYDAVRACCMENNEQLGNKQVPGYQSIYEPYEHFRFSASCKGVLKAFANYYLLDEVKRSPAELVTLCLDDAHMPYTNLGIMSQSVLDRIAATAPLEVAVKTLIPNRAQFDAAALALELFRKRYGNYQLGCSNRPEFVKHLKSDAQNWQQVLHELQELEAYDPLLFANHMLTKRFNKELMRQQDQGTEM